MIPLKDISGTKRRKTLKTLRAAAIAGIIFAVLYGTTLVLLYLSVTPVRKADIT